MTLLEALAHHRWVAANASEKASALESIVRLLDPGFSAAGLHETGAGPIASVRHRATGILSASSLGDASPSA